MKPRILMVAYACDPAGTGEHWLGWGWAEQASKDFEVDLLTRPHGGEALVRAARDAGIRLHIVAVPRFLWKLTQPFGSLGSWLRIYCWQKLALCKAREIHAQRHFNIVHQTTFHSFRAPFLCANLGIPSVWGPIAGGESIPPGFAMFLGKSRISEALRSVINRICLNVPSIRKSLIRSNVIFSSNRTTLDFLPASVRSRTIIVPANATNSLTATREARLPCTSEQFTMVYVGNCVARRGISLALHSLKNVRLKNWRFYVAGSGPALKEWKKLSVQLALSNNVIFTGRISRDELETLYARADAFVFPSLRDSGGSGLLEAMEKGVPVVCLDWGGPGEMVEGDCGIKISTANPAQTMQDLASTLEYLQADPLRGFKLASNAHAALYERFSWEQKRLILRQTYERIMSKSQPPS